MNFHQVCERDPRKITRNTSKKLNDVCKFLHACRLGLLKCVSCYFFNFFFLTTHTSFSSLSAYSFHCRGCNTIIFDRQMCFIIRNTNRNASKRLHETCKFSAAHACRQGLVNAFHLSPRLHVFCYFLQFFIPILSFSSLSTLPLLPLTRVEDTTQSDKQIYFRRCFALRENRGLKKRETEGYYTTRERTQEHADSIFPGN